MSLQVWLPLTEDLRNQGLKNVTVTDGEATIDDNGKIGKCYRFGTAKSFLELPAEAMNDFTTECTVSFWLKILTRNTSWATYFQAGLGGTPWNNYVFGFLRNGSGNKCCFTVSGEAGTSSGSFVTSDMELDTWYHITLVYQTGHCLIYMDGMLYHDYPTEIVPAFNNITTITIGCANTKTNYQSNCLLNDLRIYDHALSPREVKHLAQGLVLHYPLNRGGFGKDNICKNRDVYLTGSDYGAYSTRSYDNEAHIGKIQVTDTDHRWNAWKFGADDLDATCVELTTGVNTYTMSVDIKVTNYTTGKIICMFDFRTGNTVSKKATAVLTKEQCDGSWHRVSATLTTNDEKHNQCLWSINSNGTVHGSQTTIEYKNWKLERGDVATPWLPNPADDIYSALGFDDGIEYDVSGYRNNGTRNGTFSWSGDTPRYNTSAVFNGSSDIRSAKSSFGWFDFKEGTVSAWFKPTNTTQTWASVGVQNDGGAGSRSFSICNYSGKAATVVGYDSYWGNQSSGYSMAANTWYHLCATITNGNAVKLYVNGELVQTRTVTNTTGTIASTTQFAVGVDLPGSDERFTGQLSDVRFYTTCLNELDVRELYNTSMSLSDNGLLFGYEFIG